MARIDGGEMLIRVLKQQGIRDIFTLHGGHLDAIRMPYYGERKG